MSETKTKPTLAVWKFTSCDGCQLSLLDCEDELLAIAGAVDIAYFPEATRAMKPGPYDVSLVEGSLSTPEHLEQIKEIRAQSHILVSIGACATSGGIQALRNLQNVNEMTSAVYAHPEYIETLADSRPVDAEVHVDFMLRGCPISKAQLIELLIALLQQRKPNLAQGSVCMECKKKQVVCVMVAKGQPCLGPVTHAGCDALCPSYNRGCFGCFGHAPDANVESIVEVWRHIGCSDRTLHRAFDQFHAGTEVAARARAYIDASTSEDEKGSET